MSPTEAFWFRAAERAIAKRDTANAERQIIRDSLRRNDVTPWGWCELLNCSRSSLYRRLGPGGAGLSRGQGSNLGGGWSTPPGDNETAPTRRRPTKNQTGVGLKGQLL